MKKAISFLALFTGMALLLAGCSGSKTVTVKLPGNATTGYTWICSSSAPNVMDVKSSIYTAPNSGKMGEGGSTKFVLEAKANGQTTITFAYLRAWEQQPALNTAVYTYNVKNGKIEELSHEENLEGLS